jgi:hypothetical protein
VAVGGVICLTVTASPGMAGLSVFVEENRTLEEEIENIFVWESEIHSQEAVNNMC